MMSLTSVNLHLYASTNAVRYSEPLESYPLVMELQRSPQTRHSFWPFIDQFVNRREHLRACHWSGGVDLLNVLGSRMRLVLPYLTKAIILLAVGVAIILVVKSDASMLNQTAKQYPLFSASQCLSTCSMST